LDLKEIKELIALMRKNDLSVFKNGEGRLQDHPEKGTDFQPVITTTAPVAPASAPAVTAVPVPKRPPPCARSPTDGRDFLRLRRAGVRALRVGGAGVSEEHGGVHNRGNESDERDQGRNARGDRRDVAEHGKPVQFGQALFKLR